MICTTLNKIREHKPCTEGWEKLLKHLGKTKADNEPLPFAVIVASNGLDDALWCCRTVDGYDKEWRLFAVWCARQVQYLMTDERSINALDIAEKYANGEATKEQLNAAKDAARAAEEDAAETAADAVMAIAKYAAYYASRDAAKTAASWATAKAAQKQQFLKIVG